MNNLIKQSTMVLFCSDKSEQKHTFYEGAAQPVVVRPTGSAGLD